MTSRWRTQDSVLTNENLLDAVCGSDLCDHLHHLGVVVTAVTADNEECILSSLGDGLEEGSNEVLGVVLLLEDYDLLAEARAVRTIYYLTQGSLHDYNREFSRSGFLALCREGRSISSSISTRLRSLTYHME
jgi:hypothetical protein